MDRPTKNPDGLALFPCPSSGDFAAGGVGKELASARPGTKSTLPALAANQ